MSAAPGTAGRPAGDGSLAAAGPARPPGGTGRRPAALLTTATVALGAGMAALPAISSSAVRLPLTIITAALVLVSAAGPAGRWRAAGAVAAVAAVLESAVSHPAAATLVAEGMLILGYLLLLDAPRPVPAAGLARWLRQQAPAVGWGAATSVTAVVLLAVPVPTSAWLLVAGSAAAVAAALTALPRHPPRPPHS